MQCHILPVIAQEERARVSITPLWTATAQQRGVVVLRRTYQVKMGGGCMSWTMRGCCAVVLLLCCGMWYSGECVDSADGRCVCPGNEWYGESDDDDDEVRPGSR